MSPTFSTQTIEEDVDSENETNPSFVDADSLSNTEAVNMEDIQQQLNELSNALNQERILRRKAEERLAENMQNQQRPAAELQPMQTAPTNVDTAPQTKGPKVATLDKFHGICGVPAEVFASQVQFYIMAHPYQFPDDRSKVIFAMSYLTGTASSWAQPLTIELFDPAKSHQVTFGRFVQNFKAMYFDTEKKTKAEKALRIE